MINLNIKNIFSKQNKILLLLLFILAIGIFVRTYKFYDWLRFNADQARDATVVYGAAVGNDPLPLLGPKAGGTSFKLGPVFYYFQYISVKIFGTSPDKYAYPDLFFSILTILLLYLLLKKVFETKISLLVVLICSVSLFMVKYGRFAWNPNSMPFFMTLFLFSAQAMLANRKREMFWTGVFGASLGIGIQLHTFLLLVLPLTAAAFFGYLAYYKNFSWKKLVLVLGLVFFLNTPQFISEFQTNFANTKAFAMGTQVKSLSSYSLLDRAGMDLQCHIRANAFIVSSLGDSNECIKYSVGGMLKKNNKNPNGLILNIMGFSLIFIMMLFSIGGYALLGYFAKRENDPAKRAILFLVIVYAMISFFALIPIGNDLSIRYFLASAFVPFFLLAVWIKVAWDNFKWTMPIVLGVVFILFLFNVRALNKEALDFEEGKNSDTEMSILGEIEPLAVFIANNSQGQKKVYLTGGEGYVRRFKSPLAYLLLSRNKIELLQFEENKKEDGSVIFYVNKKSSQRKKETSINGYSVKGFATSGKLDIAALE